jgi:hypothetical protein
MEITKTKIFIGHANPQDNEFTGWLQSRLINEGYEVESDLSMLIGGERDFWKNIQTTIGEESAKYLLVLSNDTFEKDGVIDEWEYAKSIEKENDLSDFIIPLRIDDVAYNTRIGLNKRNIIKFKIWSIGLKTLLRKLKKDNVPKVKTSGLSLSMNHWYRNRFTTSHGIERKHEKFFSNRLKIEGLPDTLYFFEYKNDTQAKKILDLESNIPIIRHDDYLITFQDKLEELHDHFGLHVKPVNCIEIPTQSIFEKYESQKFPQYQDARRFLVRLLKETFHKALHKKGLLSYELSGRTKGFYYTDGFRENNKVFFPYESKTKWRQLIGKQRESFWHYALSVQPILFPNTCYSLKAHIFFSDDGEIIWDSKSKLHTARRSKGKRMFNKEWRDLMLAFLFSLTSEDEKIHLPLTLDEELVLLPTTMEFHCNFGYTDPIDNARMVPIDDYEEIEDDLLDEYYNAEEDE